MGMVLLACLFALFVATPSDVFASGSTAATATCQKIDTGDSNPVNCLPSGRWASAIGSIQTRTEPAGGVFKAFYNIGDKVSKAMRLTMPTMLLMLTQVLWNSALSLNQFAASFNVLDTFGQKLYKSVANVVTGVMSGGVASVMIVLAIFGVVGAAAFGRGSTGTAVKRLMATVLSIAVVSVMGVAAAADGRSGTPVAGSPWWVVTTLNKQINNMTVTVNLDDVLAGSDSNMMAYRHRGLAGHNCQDYVAAMRREYKDTGKSSSVVLAADRLWEETALRSWVTMQWGNPTAGGQSSNGVAANAQQAYCHVLDMQANTPTEVQKNLTNSSLGTFIDPTTAKWLFTPEGWIDPWATVVNQKKEEGWDRTDVYPMRAGIFWETCTMNGSLKPTARGGWRVLINNIGDDGSGEIKGNGGSDLRAGRGGDSPDANLQNVTPTAASASKNLMAAGNAETDVSKVCDAVFTNGVFHHGTGKKVGADTDLGDAAVLGWRFDVPNVSGTWNEANMLVPQSGAQDDAKTTVNYFYGNSEVDTSGAIGTCVGALVNGTILSLLAVALIVSKLMLLLMLLMLVFAFIVRMFPFGEAANNALKNWFKFTCELCMVGTLYSILGSVATFISSIFLNVTSGMSSTFLYNILAGCSMGIALMVIQLFFSKILKVRNVFSLSSIMGAVGMGSLYNGASRAFKSATRGALYRAGGDMLRGHRGKKRMEGQHSSQNAGPKASSDSADVLSKNADETSRTQTGEAGQMVGAGQTPGESTADGQGVSAAMADRTQVASVDGTTDSTDGGTTDGTEGSTEDELGPDMRNPLEKAVDDVKNSLPGLAVSSAGKDAKAAGKAAYSRGRNHAFGGGTHLAGGLLAAAAAGRAVFKNPLLRGTLKRGAKVAATAGIAAAALSNPITAPAGLFLAGKALMSRSVRHTAGGVIGGGVMLADAGVHQLNRGIGAGARWFANRPAARRAKNWEAAAEGRKRDDQTFLDVTDVTPEQAVQYALDQQVIRNGGQPTQTKFSDGQNTWEAAYTTEPYSEHTVTMDSVPTVSDIPGVSMPVDVGEQAMSQHFDQKMVENNAKAARQFVETMKLEDVHRQAMDAQASYVHYNDPYKGVPAPTQEPPHAGAPVGQSTSQPTPQSVARPSAPRVNPQPVTQENPQSASQPTPRSVASQSAPRVNPQPSQQPAPQPARQSAPQPVRQTTPQVNQQAVTQANQQAVTQANQQPAPQPVRQSAPRPAPQVNQQAVPQATPQPAQQVNPQSMQQSQQPMPQSVARQSAQQSTPQASPQAAPQPTPQAAPQPTPQVGQQASPQPAPQPVRQSAPQPAQQPASQPVRQPMPQVNPQTVSQPAPQVNPQPVRQPAPQATPQPTQPTRQANQQVTPQPAPQVNQQPAPQSARQVNPQSTQPSPQPAPQPAVRQSAPQPLPQASPQPARRTVRQQPVVQQPAPQPVRQATPQVTPQPTPQATSQVTPQASPQSPAPQQSTRPNPQQSASQPIQSPVRQQPVAQQPMPHPVRQSTPQMTPKSPAPQQPVQPTAQPPASHQPTPQQPTPHQTVQPTVRRQFNPPSNNQPPATPPEAPAE